MREWGRRSGLWGPCSLERAALDEAKPMTEAMKGHSSTPEITRHRKCEWCLCRDYFVLDPNPPRKLKCLFCGRVYLETPEKTLVPFGQ